MGKQRRYCDAAVEILTETKNPAVMWGDGVLLHQIAHRAGRPSDGYRTEQRVLDALTKQPGILRPLHTRAGGIPGRLVRIFRLPEDSNA